ncbi:MAG: acetoacetate--CoA ligase [Candidatus Dormibacteria bacterium]
MASVVGPEEGTLLWRPQPGSFASSRMGSYVNWLKQNRGTGSLAYEQLWGWSTAHLEDFWDSLWDYFRVLGERGEGPVLERRQMPGAAWFPEARLNYAENALRGAEGLEVALEAHSELRPPRRVSGPSLRRQVGSLASHLQRLGVGPGDRVAAYLPNIPEAVTGFLATASLGAIWSSCSPDFGEQAVLDRFQQISPKVLLAVDGYRYGGRDFDRRGLVERLRRQLPSLVAVIQVPYLFADEVAPAAGALAWSGLLRDEANPAFRRVGFQWPLWILYSSGTTGLPKPIVQGHGGILLEHLKVLGLHADLGRGDRNFWFTTTGWMMWNYLVSSLLVGATPVLYDGSPVAPQPDRLWRLAADARITHFGTSAAHLGGSLKAGLSPKRQFDLSALRFLGSTGSPLSPAAFAWAYREVKEDLWMVSLSGGTDLCTAFLLGCPGKEVRAGVIQCRGLGANIEAFDESGRPVVDKVGELVIRDPMPSMPVRLWGDEDDRRYRQSYFERYPGIWRHGDWIRLRPDGGVVIYGRSDSTLNRHGVRIGTSEIYRVVEAMPEVEDSLVLEIGGGGGESQLWLFVVPAKEGTVDEGLVRRIKAQVREQVSPRHVPDEVRNVARIPRTLSGKKLEVPLRRILEGSEVEVALDPATVADPQSLAPFLELARELAAAAGSG